jgi:tRNA dimethylallyltransferase
MFADGLLEEAKKIAGFSQGLSPNLQKAIGYREAFDFLDDRYSYQEMVSKVQQNTRRFAKRQMTWLRRFPIHWLNMQQSICDLEKLAHQSIEIYQKAISNMC